MFALADHAIGVDRGHLGAHRSWHGGADFSDHIEERASGLCYKGRVGGHPVEQPGGRQIANFVYVGGIDEEFHDMGSFWRSFWNIDL